jgi:hypothetical protein
MHLMSVGQINDHDCRVILDPDFTIFRIITLVTWLALAPIVVIHRVFGSLTGFVFLLLHPLVLSALPLLLHPHRHFLSGIIIWAILVAPGCLYYFIDVF